VDSEDISEDEEEAQLRRLAENLPAHLRQKVLMGQEIDVDAEVGSSDSDYDDDEGGEAARKRILEGWGKKKNYYDGDTADLEIGQELQDAYNEEEAAIELQRERLGQMEEADFFDDDIEDEEEEAELPVTNKSAPGSHTGGVASLNNVSLDGGRNKVSYLG